MEGTEKSLDQEIHELVTRLTDLAEDRKSFFRDDGDDEVFREDFNALVRAAELLEILLMDSKNCNDVLAALTAYEDTGCTPEMIDAAVRFLGGIDVDRVMEIAEAEREGRLIVLQFKPGEVVYCVFPSVTRIMERHIPKVVIDLNGILTLFDDRESKVATAGSIGKTVFLNRAAAEQALAKRKGGIVNG